MQLVMCTECKNVFPDSEMKRVRHSDGDAWCECPYCGSDALDDVEQCDWCGEYREPRDMYNGLCIDCLETQAEDIVQMMAYGEARQYEADINALYWKAFEGRINDILANAFMELPREEQLKAAKDLASDDYYDFADFVKEAME